MKFWKISKTNPENYITNRKFSGNWKIMILTTSNELNEFFGTKS